MSRSDGITSRRTRREGPEFEAFIAGVGRRVAWLRERSKLTQQALADLAEMDLTLLQRIERGDANPTTLIWCDLSRALRIEPHQLLRPRRAENPAKRKPGRPRKRPL